MSRSDRRGLSLMECLIVFAMLAILAGLMLPAVRRVREPAARSVCQNNLRMLMLGMVNYESNERPGRSESTPHRMFPPGCVGPGTTPEERLSWVVAVLPHLLEQEPLYKQFDIEKGFAGNSTPAATILKVVRCPSSHEGSDHTKALNNYLASAGIGADAAARPAGDAGNGFMGYDRITAMSAIKDGSANTIALMETTSGLGPWARGGPSTLRGFVPGEPSPFGSDHKDGFTVALADGSVRFLKSSIDPKVLAAAITIAGGESETLE